MGQASWNYGWTAAEPQRLGQAPVQAVETTEASVGQALDREAASVLENQPQRGLVNVGWQWPSRQPAAPSPGESSCCGTRLESLSVLDQSLVRVHFAEDGHKRGPICHEVHVV